MTLIAAFRCVNDGILLCADRQEDDAITKRSVDKIYRIQGLIPCDIFIAAAGPATIIPNVNAEIEESFRKGIDDGRDILVEHRIILENSLEKIYTQYEAELQADPMGLIIVIAPRAIAAVPVMYKTYGKVLIPEYYYAADGIGRIICDYLADRLYAHGLGKDRLALLAAFIFKEASDSSSRVGSGTDMIFIHEGNKSLHYFPPDAVKELEAGIPSLRDCVHLHWNENAKLPQWWKAD